VKEDKGNINNIEYESLCYDATKRVDLNSANEKIRIPKRFDKLDPN